MQQLACYGRLSGPSECALPLVSRILCCYLSQTNHAWYFANSMQEPGTVNVWLWVCVYTVLLSVLFVLYYSSEAFYEEMQMMPMATLL